MSLKKDFIVQPEWDPALASHIEDFLNRLMKQFVNITAETYTGDGRSDRLVAVSGLGKPPIAVFLQNDAGVHTLVVVPRGTNAIASWNQKGFTPAITWNVGGKVYEYVVMA